MASNFLSRSPIPPTAATLSAGFLGLGALHFFTPFQLCEFFGVPSSPNGLQRPGALPFIYANGGREVMLGIALWIMGRQRNREGINALLYGMSVCMPIKDDYRLPYTNRIQLNRWPHRWMRVWCGRMVARSMEDGKGAGSCTPWEAWLSG